MSRDPSPMSYEESLSFGIASSRHPSLYDDINIDPFLRYGEIEQGIDAEGSGTLDRSAEEILASDHLFQQSLYDSDPFSVSKGA